MVTAAFSSFQLLPVTQRHGDRIKSNLQQQSLRTHHGIFIQNDLLRGPLLVREAGSPEPIANSMEVASENGAEPGEEIFLMNLDNATPETVPLRDEEYPVIASPKKDLELSSSENDPASPNDASNDTYGANKVEHAHDTNRSFQEIGEEIKQQQEISEDVEAVWKASKDATMAAEANLSAEMMAELSAVGGTNVSECTGLVTITETEASPLDDLVGIVPAEEVVGEPIIRTAIEAPTVAKILKFAVPAVGVWLCSPLLSLIDTSAVGVLSGTTQQAALNPAVAVTDYAALLIAFLYTATTNLVAAAQESDRTIAGKPRTTKTMIGAMQLSTFVGAGLGAALFIFAKQLLRAIIGNDSINPDVFAAATKYVRIRALGMPAAAIIGSAQAASLGMQDLKSPLYVLLAAAVVNFLGDMIFVGSKHSMIGGCAGAAWATVFSQYAALAIFIRWLVEGRKESKSKPLVVNLTNNIQDFMGMNSVAPDGSRTNTLKELVQAQKLKLQARAAKKVSQLRAGSALFTATSKTEKTKIASSKPKEEGFSVRGMLDGKFRVSDLVKFPSKEITTEFTPYVAPVTITQIGRVSGYIVMSHVVSSSLGTTSMAAQQVIVSFFYCLTPIADSLSLTAQSFIPGISERKPSKERAIALRNTGVNFLKAGGVFGAVMAAAIGLMPLFSGVFTADPAVRVLVGMVVPLLMAFFAVHGILCAAEGVLLGQKDLGFLGKMYGVYFFAVPFFMLRVKRAALSGSQDISLKSVWTVFLGYQMFRLAAWVARVGLIQRKTDHIASALEEAL